MVLCIRDHIELVVPEPEVLRIIGEEAEQSMSSTLTSREIDRIVKAGRSGKKKR